MSLAVVPCTEVPGKLVAENTAPGTIKRDRFVSVCSVSCVRTSQCREVPDLTALFFESRNDQLLIDLGELSTPDVWRRYGGGPLVLILRIKIYEAMSARSL